MMKRGLGLILNERNLWKNTLTEYNILLKIPVIRPSLYNMLCDSEDETLDNDLSLHATLSYDRRCY